MKRVKLKKVEITDYKGIDKLSEEVNGNHFIFFGKNGCGKTTLMEVINRSALRIEPKDMADLPIKLGAKNAKTGIVYIVENDGVKTEILVETVYRPSGSIMRLVDLSNNGELKPTMERLIQLIGKSVDVSPLMDMQGKDQFKFMLKVLGSQVSIDNFEKSFKEKYTERRLLNKQIKNAETDLEIKSPSVDILVDYRAKGSYANKKELPNKPDKTDLLTALSEAEKCNIQIVAAENACNEIEKQIADLQQRLQKGKEWISDNPKKEVEPIQKQIAEFDTNELAKYEQDVKAIKDYNRTVDAIQVHIKSKKELEEKEAERDNLQKEMDNLQGSMQAAVSALKIEDLAPELKLFNEIDEDGEIKKQGLYYKLGENDYLPFNRRQISYGKCIVSLAKISSYLNFGKLNLIHIPAWESLDKESRTEILTFAKDNEDLSMQFAIEEVESKPLGIKIIETLA